MPSINKYTRWSGVWSLTEVAQAKASNKWPTTTNPLMDLFAWGKNTSGELGIGDATAARSSPVQLGSHKWTSFSAGLKHCGGIKSDGTLWLWGSNAFGQLGFGTVNNYSYPKQVGSDSNWQKVVCGYKDTIALKKDGTLWCWGDNTYGTVGDNTVISRSSPVQIGALTTWTDVSLGIGACTAIKSDGTMWGWGYNGWGNVGDGSSTTVHRSSPVQIGSGIGSDWISVAGGGYHQLAMRSGGGVYGWGRNNYGQAGGLGDKSTPSLITGAYTAAAISGGTWHTGIISTDGTLWFCGRNDVGQFGNNGTNSIMTSATQTGSSTDWSKISCGFGKTMVIKTDKTLWAMGTNNDGDLGINSLITKSSPTQVGSGTNWTQVSVSSWSDGQAFGGVT